MAHKLYAIREARAQLREHPPARPVVDLDTRWDRPLLGNRVSQIYHTPDQHNDGDVHPKNQVRFATEREAMAGRLPAGGE